MKYRIGKIFIAVTDPSDAQKRIISSVNAGGCTYVCVSNPRTIDLAYKDSKYRSVMSNSLFNAPDAQPTVWAARLWGLKQVQRTMGPYLFRDMLHNPESGMTHFLLGDTDETLTKIVEKARSNGALIAGSYSPPFCDLDDYDYEDVAKRINDSGANLVWISMRAPKQDYFASRLIPFLNGQVCIGVGAAFRFYLGEYKMAPAIIKKLGLMGLYWGTKGQPFFKFLFGYFSDNLPYLWLLVNIIFRRIIGKKYYE